MKRLSLLFALVFAMLIAAMHPAEAAYGGDDFGAVAAHVLVVSHDGADTSEQRGDRDGADGIGHHHCPTCWIADEAPRIEQLVAEANSAVADRYTILSSRSEDPLLEPPSA